MKRAFALALMLAWLAPAGAAESPPSPAPSPQAATVPARDTACGLAASLDRVAQVSQTDCCKGHKGVCGCRAGKIVCCDNTVSVNCTCHADSGQGN
jgi:hypothetical protein